MIKRYYFYSGVVNYDEERKLTFDGIVECKSWFPKPKLAYDSMRNDLCQACQVKDTSAINITAFNKI